VSSKSVADGDLLTVTFTDVSIFNGVSRIWGVAIEIFYGDIEVVDFSPKKSFDYNGVDFQVVHPMKDAVYFVWKLSDVGGAGVYEEAPDDKEPLPGARSVYTYPSPSTFTVTVRLVKGKDLAADGVFTGKCVIAGNTLGHIGLNTRVNLNTEDDLSIQKVDIIQRGVVDPKQIIADEGVFFRVIISSTFNQDVTVDLAIIYDFGAQHYVRKDVVIPGKSTSWVILPKYGFGPPPSSRVVPSAFDASPIIMFSKDGVDTGIRILIDPDNEVKESDESNNEVVLTAEVVIISEPPGPPIVSLSIFQSVNPLAILGKLARTDLIKAMSSVRGAVKKYTGDMTDYLKKCQIWGLNLPIPEGKNMDQLKRALDTLCGAEKTSIQILSDVSSPFEIEPDIQKTMEKLTGINSELSQVSARAKEGSLSGLQQNVAQLTGVQKSLAECAASFNALTDRAVTLSASNEPQDLIELEQTLTVLKMMFENCQQLTECIDETNQTIIRNIK
jgi:hypothetical protein